MSRGAQQTSSQRKTLYRLLALFFVSGGTSLVYQTLWARQLYLLIGTTQLAITIVLAAFMCGLAIGGVLAARYASLVERPLFAFAVLEALIGLYAVGFSLLLDPITHLYLALSSALPLHSISMALCQFFVLGVLLLPPTVCMGATLPLLSRFASPKGRDAGKQVGRLYGANTLGAVVGTALAGFVLLPQLGMSATVLCAGAGNALVALAAAQLSRKSAPTRPRKSSKRVRSEPDSAKLEPLLVIAGLGGFASLLCEVAWFRLLTLILGGSAYSFTVMLLAFLLGIGIGGWAGGSAADRHFEAGGSNQLLRRLGLLQLGVATSCWFAMFAYGELPFAFVRLFGLLGDQPVYMFAAKLGLSLAVMLIPTTLMGMSFPFLVRAAVGRTKSLDRIVGLLYGANTVGAIAGASLGGLLLLPALHIRGGVLLAASINLIAAALAYVLAVPRPLRAIRIARPAAAALAAITFIHWVKPPWDPILMSSGMYKYASDLESQTREGLLNFAVRPFELIFYEEGLSSIVTVARSKVDEKIWLANNGKVDASSDGDLSTQVMLAHLPAIFRPNAERALVIGLASGITVGSMLFDESLKSVDVAEIEAATIRASHSFDDINNRPLEDPRTHLYPNDARNHLVRTPEATYDIVVSEPSNPWLSGVSNLFTREFFELGKRRLSPGGVWAQWLQIYGLDPNDLKSVMATFASVYPEIKIFRVGKTDLVMIGSSDSLDLHVVKIDEYVSSNQGAMSDMNRVGIQRAEDIVGMLQFGGDVVLEIADGERLNTDDNMRIEYAAPLSLHKSTAVANILLLERASPVAYESVNLERLPKLAYAYAQADTSMNRALAALRTAARLQPTNERIGSMYQQYLEVAEARGAVIEN